MRLTQNYLYSAVIHRQPHHLMATFLSESFRVVAFLFCFSIHAEEKNNESKCASAYLGSTGFDLRLRRVERRWATKITQFEPGKINSPDLSSDDIELVTDISGNQLNVTHESGEYSADGDVFYGLYRDDEIVVKLFRQSSFSSRLASNAFEGSGFKPIEERFANKIKQGYFIMSFVHEVGVGPRPYGFIVGEDFEKFVNKHRLPDGKYFGLIVMEKISIKWQYKKNRSKAPIGPLKRKARLVEAFMNRLGVGISDLDYVVDDRNQFYFIDFDFWNIASSSGYWKEGVKISTPEKVKFYSHFAR